MSDLHRALTDIRAIRNQVAQTTEFRGYGPLTLSSTAALAVVAGAVQARWIPQPAAHRVEYVAVWMSLAVLCAALIATETLRRANRLHAGMADEMVRLAVTQFLPAAAVGAVLPFVLLRVSPGVFWTLPGLWQIVFGLGVFASCRSLPRPMLLVGGWFVLTGLLCLGLGDARALAPITMAGAYAAGMAAVALVHVRAAGKVADDGEEGGK